MRDMIRAAYRETWAIRPHWLNAALAQAEVAAVKAKLPSVSGSIALLPLYGPISQRASIWQEMFGGTSTEAFGAAFVRAINADRIGGVVIDVDSPGGTTAGVQELADIIHEGAQRKPVVAVANSTMASAAYWIASQVGPGRLMAAPGADVGSIGVFRLHEDVSEMLAHDGVKVTFLAMPEHKTEANPFEPLSAEAAQHHLQQVAATYDQFVGAVARGRGITTAAVKKGYGGGRTFHAEEAQQMGLVDGVATLRDVVGKMGVSKGKATIEAHDRELQEMLLAAWNSERMEAFAPLQPVPVRRCKERLDIMAIR